MIVGVDVHKRSHAAALVDERGVAVATLTIPNSRDGVARLRRWLGEHGAEQALVGVENAAGYGRLVCAMLAAAGHEVLNVPAWRVKRERPHEGPGKSDPADAVAIAHCVLRHREKLGPALEPALIRAIAFLDTHRRQSVGGAPTQSSACVPYGRRSIPRPKRPCPTSRPRECSGGSRRSISVTTSPSEPPPAASTTSLTRSSS